MNVPRSCWDVTSGQAGGVTAEYIAARREPQSSWKRYLRTATYREPGEAASSKKSWPASYWARLKMMGVFIYNRIRYRGASPDPGPRLSMKRIDIMICAALLTGLGVSGCGASQSTGPVATPPSAEPGGAAEAGGVAAEGPLSSVPVDVMPVGLTTMGAT